MTDFDVIMSFVAKVFVVSLFTLAVFGIYSCAKELDVRVETEIEAKCDVYRENPTWVNTVDAKVWVKLNCKQNNVEKP